jgi:hypothetical protein
MRLLIDENVPEAVTSFLRDRGHEILLVRDRLPGAADPVIAHQAQELNATVITWNHRHFRAFSARPPEGGTPRFPRLRLVSFLVRESNGRRRAEELIDLIEFENQQAEQRSDRRVMIEIQEHAVRIVR